MTSDTKVEQKKEQSGLVTAYLVLYNVLQFLGWTAIYVLLAVTLTSSGNCKYCYHNTKFLLHVFQTGALLEVIHIVLGLVRSNLFLTFFQVLSRLFVVWGITWSVPEAQTSVGVPMFLFAWSITEMIRYAFYATNIVGNVPYVVTWCRYTLFIALYPIGVTGELLATYAALPTIKNSGLYTFSLPNEWNISFDYYSMVIFGMFMYIPIFPQLYLHMFAQRKKVIGGAKSKEA